MWIQRSSWGFKLSPRQVFPEGLMSSCRADKSNTLAQNGHCELWSGMYLTCNNRQYTWREIAKQRTRKGGGVQVAGNSSKSCAIRSWTEGAAQWLVQKDQITTPVQKLKTEIERFDVPVLGLAGCHGRKNCENEVSKAGTWLQRPRIILLMNAALLLGKQLQTWDCSPAN